MKTKLSKIEKAAFAWAKQRKKFRRVESLGLASCRAALYTRSNELENAVDALILKESTNAK